MGVGRRRRRAARRHSVSRKLHLLPHNTHRPSCAVLLGRCASLAAATCSIGGAAPGVEVDSTVRWCLARQMPRAAREDRRA